MAPNSRDQSKKSKRAQGTMEPKRDPLRERVQRMTKKEIMAIQQAQATKYRLRQSQKLLTDDEAESKANALLRDVTHNRSRLVEILQICGIAIKHIWERKRREQRKRILQSAFPKMPEHHRPDWKAFRKETASDSSFAQPYTSKETSSRAAFLWPYLNLEDLSSCPTRLLKLLNSRSGHNPDEFFASDAERLRFATLCGAIPCEHDPDSEMRLCSSSSVDNFIDIVLAAVKSGKHLSELETQATYIPTWCLLLVLQSQLELIKMLIQICEAILNSVADEHLLRLLVQRVSPMIPIDNNPTWSKVSNLQLEAAYGVPGQLDIDRLQALVSGMITQAQDHLHGMKEDPEVFAETLEAWSEHNPQQLKSANGEPSGVWKNSKLNQLFWGDVAVTAVNEAYRKIVTWTVASHLLQQLDSYITQNNDRLIMGKPCPDGLRRVFLTAYAQLCIMNMTVRELFLASLCASPHFREYTQIHSTHPRKMPTAVLLLPPGKPMYDLVAILMDEQQSPLLGDANILDEMQYLIDIDQESSDMLTPLLQAMMGEVALIAEFKRQLCNFHPWSDIILAGRGEGACQPYEDTVMGLCKPATAFQPILDRASQVVGEHNFLGDTRFLYPAGKKRSKIVVDRMRQSEANLDAFGSKLDAVCQQQVSKPLDGFFADFVQPRALKRTPPWVDQSNDAMYDKFRMLDLAQRTERTLQATESEVRKEKTKTRGLPKGQNAALPPDEPTDIPAPTQVQHAVHKRAYKVFSAIFYDPEDRDAPGVMAWSDFLAAMSAMGFKVEKTWGSVWQFTPTKLYGVEKSIAIHEPHPEAKLSPWHARRIGRRLTRNYGWTRETFVRA